MTHRDSALIPLQRGYLPQPVHPTLKKFIGGGRSLDFSVRAEYALVPQVAPSALVQYERKLPALSTAARTNTNTPVQQDFYCNLSIRK